MAGTALGFAGETGLKFTVSAWATIITPAPRRYNARGVEKNLEAYYPECAAATPGFALERLQRSGRL
ncbi:MAG TPA: hypothetical protein VK395_12045 [Gemmataceae bacterium]|nr:hypothetical protein [Gemmataceae bacterium]